METGFRRTALLTPESTSYADSTIEDYAERTPQTVTAWQSVNGLQGGDPAKLAGALIQLAELDEPSLRFAVGADAVDVLETRTKALQNQANAHRELSINLAHDGAWHQNASGRRREVPPSSGVNLCWWTPAVAVS